MSESFVFLVGMSVAAVSVVTMAVVSILTHRAVERMHARALAADRVLSPGNDPTAPPPPPMEPEPSDLERFLAERQEQERMTESILTGQVRSTRGY